MTWPIDGNVTSLAHGDRDDNLARQLAAMNLRDKPGSSRSSKLVLHEKSENRTLISIFLVLNQSSY